MGLRDFPLFILTRALQRAVYVIAGLLRISPLKAEVATDFFAPTAVKFPEINGKWKI